MLKHRVLVKKDGPRTKTDKGIILPKAVNQNTGTVVKIGPETPYLKIGDRVLFHANAGIEIENNGQPHIILGMDKNAGQVIAIL